MEQVLPSLIENEKSILENTVRGPEPLFEKHKNLLAEI